MTNSELLKAGRDGLLGLHKILVDRERARYEAVNGSVTSGQFLNLLLEDSDFAWLRTFSTLIVDIDEMFAQKDGFGSEAVDLHLNKLRDLIGLKWDDADILTRYQNALQDDPDAAAKHAELKALIGAG